MAEATNAITAQTLQAARDGLSKKITAEISRLQKLAEQNEDAEETKRTARAQYDACLDRGDADGMAEALSRIREANQPNEQLISSLSKAAKVLSDLRDVHTGLRAESSKLLADARQKIERSQAEFHTVDDLHNSIGGLLSSLNELAALLVHTKDRFGIAINAEPCCESS